MKQPVKSDDERWWAIEQKMERYHYKLEKQYRTDVKAQYSGLATNVLAEIGSALWGVGTQLLALAIIVFMCWTFWYFGERTGVLIPNPIPWIAAPLILAAGVLLMGTGHLVEKWGKRMFRARKK